MPITPEQNEILQALASMVRQTAGVREPIGGGGDRKRTEEQREAQAEARKLEAGLKDLSKADKAIKNLNKAMDLASKGTGRYTQDLKSLPANLRKSLEASNLEAVKKMGESVNELKDVLRIEDQLAANQTLINTLNKYKDKTEVSGEQFDEIASAAKHAGVSVGRLIDPTTKTVKNFDKLQEETDALADAMDEAARNTTRMSRAVNAATEAYNKHKQALKDSFNAFVEENRIMRERAANDSKYSDALIGLGISMKDWSTILADNRATQQAMAAGGRDFTTEIKAGADQMVMFSRDNVQAAKTTAQMMKGISGFGVSQKNLGGALDEQIKMYKENFRVFDMTAEAFAQYTEQLVADADIRTNLTLMAEKERKSFVLSLQARESERLEMGYTAEQARELTKTFAKLAGETPKERMKKAAKQRAMMGALGMSAEGAELQQLMVNINTMQGKERGDALKRIEEIQRGAANQLQERKREGLAAEMFFSQVADKTGFADTARQLETLTMTGKERDKAAATRDMADREVPHLISMGIDALDTIKAFQATSVGLLGGILLALTKGKIFSMLGNTLKSLGKGIGNLFKGGPGGGAAGAAGKMGQAGRGAMGAMGKAGGTALRAGGAALRAAGPVAAVAGAGMLGWEIGTAINEQLSDETKKSIGDAIGPVIDNVLGFFGNEEAKQRLKYLETRPVTKVPSPVMEARKEDQQPTVKPAEDAMKTAQVEEAKRYDKQENAQTQLLATLQELQTYLKTINDQNMEQAGAVTRTAEATIEGIRFNSMQGRRPA